MIVDVIENSTAYESIHPLFKSAFAFLKDSRNHSAEDGRTDISGDKLFALTQSYETKPAHDGRHEAHRNYIDIQFIAAGEEVIGYAPLADLQTVTEFDPKSDAGFYEGPHTLIKLRRGMFAVFFPQDAHMPCRHIDKSASVKKIVLKVAVSY
ncbi:MAG: YhcH/YjgK/YiaL family protein [Kiritimatiellae bacterium]|nr:YhcH/YjgK/YiaL family protein [Kiritimatiellia bacterium]